MILTSRLFSLAVLRLTDRRELGTGSGSWAAASANGAIVVGDSRILPVRWTTPARAWRRGFVLGTSRSSERLMQAYSFSVRAGVLTVKPGLRLSLHTATFMAREKLWCREACYVLNTYSIYFKICALFSNCRCTVVISTSLCWGGWAKTQHFCQDAPNGQKAAEIFPDRIAAWGAGPRVCWKSATACGTAKQLEIAHWWRAELR